MQTEKRIYINARQKRTIVQFMELHKNLAKNHLSANFTAKDKKALWKELTDSLNSTTNARGKTEQQWRKCWKDMKGFVREKAAKVKTKLDGGYPIDHPLTELEERILLLIDENPISVHQVIPEVRIKAEEELLGGPPCPEELSTSERERSPCGQSLEVQETSTVFPISCVRRSDKTKTRDSSSSSSGPSTPYNTKNRGLGNNFRRRMSPLAEQNETGTILESLEIITKETSESLKRLADSQSKLVLLQTERNKQDAKFQEGILTVFEKLAAILQSSVSQTSKT